MSTHDRLFHAGLTGTATRVYLAIAAFLAAGAAYFGIQAAGTTPTGLTLADFWTAGPAGEMVHLVLQFAAACGFLLGTAVFLTLVRLSASRQENLELAYQLFESRTRQKDSRAIFEVVSQEESAKDTLAA